MQHLDAIWGQDKYNFYTVPGRRGLTKGGDSSWGLVHNNFQLALLVKCLFLAFLIALIIYCLVAVTVTVVVVVFVSASVSFLYIYKFFLRASRLGAKRLRQRTWPRLQFVQSQKQLAKQSQHLRRLMLLLLLLLQSINQSIIVKAAANVPSQPIPAPSSPLSPSPSLYNSLWLSVHHSYAYFN